jgi:hypothetical protein
MDLSQGGSQYELLKNPFKVQDYSLWAPDGLHQEANSTGSGGSVLLILHLESHKIPPGIPLSSQFNLIVAKN